MIPSLRVRHCLVWAFFLLNALFATSAVRADDVADEAELQFQLGVEHYQANDFRAALEHFLASNRLVPNKNVLFDIGRCYEQLKQFPDAFRYYSLARERAGEPAVKQRLTQALDRISPNVAIIDIRSTPPGATIYLDRKDLGARGATPSLLGLAPGRYHVILEAPGFETAEADVPDARIGTTTTLNLQLKQVLGTVRVQGPETGATVRVDSESAAPACTIPCTLSLPPGKHILFSSRAGFPSSASGVDVAANGETTVTPRLLAVTGPLVVDTDQRGALVEIDGKPAGFTPLVTNAPVGRHVVRISLSGFRPEQQVIDVSVSTQARVSLSLTELQEVTAASRVKEAVEDAPSDVTIITSDELRAMHYPTIAEALRGVRGIYLSDDRSYVSVGFRGFSQLGDYGNRVLVLVDGHPTNQAFTGGSFVGYDGRVDLEDVERIEIVRGPGSVLYGTGAFFGVINVVTRTHYSRLCATQGCRDEQTHAEVGLGAAGEGVTRGRASVTWRPNDEGGVWISGAAAHAVGNDFYFPEYATNTPPTVAGNARGVDGFDAGGVYGRAWYKALTLQWHFNERSKGEPTGKFDVIFGDPRNNIKDIQSFIELRFEPHVGHDVQLLSRAHVDTYGFIGGRAFPNNLGGMSETTFQGEWAGGEQRILYQPSEKLRLTVGGEFLDYFEAIQQTSSQGAGQILDRNDPYWVAAAYSNADVTPLSFLKLSAGVRYDYYSMIAAGSVNPRLAVIVHPGPNDVVKLVAGKAFRAPSVYELYFVGGAITPSVNLGPEDIYTGEAEYEHRFSSSLVATLAGYANKADHLIVLNPIDNLNSPFENYENLPVPILSFGGEAEIRREWREGWMLSASYAYSHSEYLDNTGFYRKVPNAPEHIAGLKGAAPLIPRYLQGMVRASFEGPRYDRYDRTVDTSPQGTTPSALIVDAVLSGTAEKQGIRYSLGAYNLGDWRYTVPVSSEFVQTAIVQAGRTFLATIDVTF